MDAGVTGFAQAQLLIDLFFHSSTNPLLHSPTSSFIFILLPPLHLFIYHLPLFDSFTDSFISLLYSVVPEFLHLSSVHSLTRPPKYSLSHLLIHSLFNLSTFQSFSRDEVS